MVRKRGFEPLRPFGRQPLKLVRLPFRHFRVALRAYFTGGVVTGAVEGVGGFGDAGAGFGAAAGGGADVPLTTELVPR